MAAADYDGIKKRIIAARNATHKQWGEEEKAIDRVTAFSVAAVAGHGRMAELLWRVKYAKETGWRDLLGPAVHLLIARAKDAPVKLNARHRQIRSYTLERLARIAITEWLFDQCRKCGGRGKLGAGREITVSTRVVCGSCGGRGEVERESERLRLFKLSGALAGNEIPQYTMVYKCEPCHGRGGRHAVSTRLSKLRDCPSCHGTGRLRMADKGRMREFEIPKEIYWRWKPVYLKLLRELRACDAELALRIDFRLGRGENPDDVASPELEDLFQLPGDDEADANSATHREVAP
jgi:hypothetical protein